MVDLPELAKSGFDAVKSVADLCKMVFEPRYIRKKADAWNYADKVLTEIEARRRNNLSDILQETAKDLDDECSYEIDPDWFSKFISITQDVSDKEVQALFSKMLAGELNNPGTYSIRTLKVLEGLSPEEAKLFVKSLCYSIKTPLGEVLLIKSSFVETTMKSYSKSILTYSDYLKLEECGISRMNDVGFKFCEDDEVSLIYGELLGIVHSDKKDVNINLDSKLTEAGKQLYHVAEDLGVIQRDYEFFRQYCISIGNRSGMKVSLHRIASYDSELLYYKEDLINCENLGK